MSIFLTAIIKAKPEHQQALKCLLDSLPEYSRKEAACIQYDVHHSIEDENIFILNEEWESLEGLDLHNEQPYSKEFFASFDMMQDKPMVYLSR